MSRRSQPLDSVPIGYRALVELYDLRIIPHFRESYAVTRGSPSQYICDGKETQFCKKRYIPKDPKDPFVHIEFALKHEGLDLELFTQLFERLDQASILNYVKAHPSGKIGRKLWFLYEFLTGQRLTVEDAVGGSYVPLLDENEYYTGLPIRSRRHLVLNNLLGGREFCPMVRRTDTLQNFEGKDLSGMATRLIDSFDPVLIARAVNYMYDIETMSSFAIERETPAQARKFRFMELLKRVDHTDSSALSKEFLIELQNSIVDPRFANHDYRDFQGFIGVQSRLDTYGGSIYYIPPKPEDVPGLMDGLIKSLDMMLEGNIHPVVIASCLAFGFVFIHPFEDGNGRLHRFLIHYVFAKTGFVPHGAIFPVSAIILKNLKQYYTLLETFSKPLLKLIPNYSFDANGQMTVKGETGLFYRYRDFTAFTEYLFACVETTINTDFKDELRYLVKYDKTKQLIQNVVDMPDKKINLFIQIVANNGQLSPSKRKDHFSMLTDEEVAEMERLVQEHME